MRLPMQPGLRTKFRRRRRSAVGWRVANQNGPPLLVVVIGRRRVLGFEFLKTLPKWHVCCYSLQTTVRVTWFDYVYYT